MRKRAQAAMEFLMTYGWAILIMLVVIAVLFYLGVFSPQSSITKSCVLPPGFSCYEFDMDSSGNIYLDIGQATGKTITVTGIGCAPSSPNATLNPNVQIPTGSHAIVTIGGTNCSGATNSNFKGKLLIQYTISGSSGTRSVTGDVSAPLIGNSSSWGGGSYGGGGSFIYRRQVTINTGVASDLTDFPAYFILNTNSLISAGKMNNSCKDLRVLDSTMSNLLDYEIENNTCNSTSTVVWFRVPQTKGTNNYIAYAFYGNNSTSDAQNKAGVWGNNFAAVWHLGDLSDSAGPNSCSLTGSVSYVAGTYGNATYFNGGSNYLVCGSSATLAVSVATWSIWFKTTKNDWNTFSEKENYGSNGYWFGYDTYPYMFFWSSGTLRAQAPVSWYMSDGVMRYVATAYNGSVVKYYTNNGSVWSYDYGSYLPIGSSGNNLYISLGGASAINGTIDEMRISSIARSDDWVKAEYGQTYAVGGEVVN